MLFEESERRIHAGKFIGGRICLDFANTVHNFGNADPEDDLPNYTAFISWAYDAGVLTESETKQLKRTSKGQHASTMRVIRNFRDSIFRTFSSAAAGKRAQSNDLEVINQLQHSAILHSRIAVNHSAYHRMWIDEKHNLQAPLWPIAKSAAELLLHPDLKHVRLCSGNNCTWLFVDLSKNHSRRWCEMRVCGNRQKSRQHYLRQTQSD
jgi:predicted RNA-binding Zn ribbon-like protein